MYFGKKVLEKGDLSIMCKVILQFFQITYAKFVDREAEICVCKNKYPYNECS